MHSPVNRKPNNQQKRKQQFQQDQQYNSKIQFFSNASSFQSSISKTQLYQGQKQIEQQTELIFLALQKQLQQLYTSQVKQKLQKILHRANILYNFTIPEHIQAQQNFNIQTKQITMKCYDKIKELIVNYQKLKNNKMDYQSFYLVYKNYETVKNYMKDKKKMDKNQSKIQFQFVQKVQFVGVNNHNKNLLLTPKASKLNPMNERYIYSQKNSNHNSSSSGFKKQKEQGNYYHPLNQQIYHYKTQIKQLNQQIFTLKKQNSNKINYYQSKLIHQKNHFYERIQKIINLKLNCSKDFLDLQEKSKLIHESIVNQEKLEIKYEHNQTSSMTILRELYESNVSLLKQIQSNRINSQKIVILDGQINKLTALNKNLISQNNRLQKMIQSYQATISDGLHNQISQPSQVKSLASLSKRNQILSTQLNILKRQLKKERQNNYKKKQILQNQKNNELNQIKVELSKRNLQIKELIYSLDQQKTKGIWLKQKIKLLSEINSKLKNKIQQQFNENQQIMKQSRLSYNKDFYRTGESFNKNGNQQSNQLLLNSYDKNKFMSQSNQKKHNKKIKIMHYSSDVLEGFVYYKCLQKEFRYRYRRACLKSKQLLFKKDNFQIGIITKKLNASTNQHYDKLQFTIFLTNQRNQTIENLQLSLINSNPNNQACISNANKNFTLRNNDQIKVTVNFTIYQYPIGSLVLCVQNLGQQIRLPLPSNIIKTFNFQTIYLDKQMMQKSGQKINFISETKIFKNFSTFIEYLTGQKKKQNSKSISLRATHSISETSLKIYMQFNDKNDEMTVFYIKQNGFSQIADYLMKNVKFLIEKQKK